MDEVLVGHRLAVDVVASDALEDAREELQLRVGVVSPVLRGGGLEDLGSDEDVARKGYDEEGVEEAEFHGGRRPGVTLRPGKPDCNRWDGQSATLKGLRPRVGASGLC